MRLPNGYGSVYKLSGNRRNPYAARVTTGWTMEPNGKSFPIYKFIGYYPTRKEALQALAEWNRDPTDASTATLADIFERWSEDYNGEMMYHTSAWRGMEELWDRKIAEIKLSDYEEFFRNSDKSVPMKRKMKTVLSFLYTYAIRHEIIDASLRSRVDYIDPGEYKPNDIHKTFTTDEIKRLWKMENEYDRVALILIYTGLRISELLELSPSDVHREERYIYIRKSKTKAGIREVPLAEKILPIFFIPSERYEHYRQYFVEHYGHLPHDTRHTCVSLLTEAGVDERIIKSIIGHAGENVTEKVYTHISLEAKIEAINKLDALL